jgi:hypothetical protein
MKIQVVIALYVVAATAATVASAQTYSPRTLVAAQVPFQFVAGGVTLSAGQYKVRQFTPTTLELSNDDGNNTYVLASDIHSTATTRQGKLVFHSYGKGYFLSQVWAAGESYGRELPTSRAERNLKREYRQAQIATVMESK